MLYKHINKKKSVILLLLLLIFISLTFFIIIKSNRTAPLFTDSKDITREEILNIITDKNESINSRYIHFELLLLKNVNNVSNTLEEIALDKTEDNIIRVKSISLLGKKGDKDSLNRIAPLLNDDDCGVRKLTAVTIGQLSFGEYTKKILERLDIEEEQSVQKSLINALGESGDQTVISYLTDTAKNHKNISIRASGANALGNYKTTEVANILTDILLFFPDERRFTVLTALSRNGTQIALETLLNETKSSSPYFSEVAAEKIIEMIKNSNDYLPVVQEFIKTNTINDRARKILEKIIN